MSETKRLVVLVVDRSGSMADIADDTEGGIKAFLEEQKNAPGQTLVSLYQFDDIVDVVYEFTPLDQVPDYKLRPRNFTALLDAVGKTTAWTLGKLDIPGDEPISEVVFVIATDGHENASRKYSLDTIKALVTKLQDDKHWKFVFIGVGIDAFQTASSLGIGAASTLHSARGSTHIAYSTAGQTVVRSSNGEDLAFTDLERDAASRQ